jgi:hypothetical protein
MPKVIKKKEVEIKSVKANGVDVTEPVRSFRLPTGEAPYWTILLESGDTLWITGQVVVKQGPKEDPYENLSDKEVKNRIKEISSQLPPAEVEKAKKEGKSN